MPTGRVVHRAKMIAPNGDVSALCFARPHPIDLSQATWTNRDEAVTCPKCLAKIAVPDEKPVGTRDNTEAYQTSGD